MRAKQIDSRKKAALDRYVVGAPLAGALYAKTRITKDVDISKPRGQAKPDGVVTGLVARRKSNHPALRAPLHWRGIG